MNNEIRKDEKIVYYIELPTEKEINTDKKENQVKVIGTNSFSNSNIEEYKCKGVEKIGKQAFADCESLKFFIEEEIEENTDSTFDLETTTLIIEEESFLNCSELRTVIFSCGKKIIIKKDAFKGCSSLRTVKLDFMDAYICGNPFEDCPEFLTFICKIDSDIERFAIEHGYRVVYEK